MYKLVVFLWGCVGHIDIGLTLMHEFGVSGGQNNTVKTGALIAGVAVSSWGLSAVIDHAYRSCGIREVEHHN